MKSEHHQSVGHQIGPPVEYYSESPVISRNALAALDISFIEKLYPGFIRGDYLKNKILENKENYIPTPELIDSILFAGQENYEGLKKYTYQRLEQKSTFYLRDLNDKHNNLPHTESVLNLSSIYKALNTVEHFMEGQTRRTGEPGMAHIYRTLLRTMDIVEDYNQLFNSGSDNLYFPPDVAEIAYLAAILHDFTEDEFEKEDGTIEIGKATAIFESGNEKNSETGFYIERKLYSPESNEIIETIESTKLDINPYHMSFLLNALNALKSNDITGSLMDHLQDYVKKLDSSINIAGISQEALSLIPYFVKCADRRDNQDTYIFRESEDAYVQTPVDKIVNKAVESIDLFEAAEWAFQYAGANRDNTFASLATKALSLVNHRGAYALNDVLTNPQYLKHYPVRWSIFTLAGIPVNDMYKIPTYGGLPTLI